MSNYCHCIPVKASPRLEQAGPSFSMSDGLSLIAYQGSEGGPSVGDYRQVRQPGS